MLAEVEPFKTTFLVGMFNRAWPYTLFVAVLLGLSIFMERPFCKYLCPLGASSAMPSTFRWVRPQAQTGMQQLQGLCGGLVVTGDRRAPTRIDHRECMHCPPA